MMDSLDREIDWRSEAVREHLTAIALFETLPNENDRQEFIKFLTKDVFYAELNSSDFSHICYFLTGIINQEERNKLIRWPLLTKQDQIKLRKGLLTMVNGYIEKYPWANIKKLPESYFLQPHGKQKRVLDFILSLTSLVMHILLNDPTVLIKNPKESFTLKELDDMKEDLAAAQLHEKKIIKNNIFPVKDFEETINTVRRKCIHLKQENDQLQGDLLIMKKELVSKGIIKKMDDNVDLQKVNEIKMNELENLYTELKTYHNASIELSSKMKAATEPIFISARDFNCEKSSELAKATSDVCETLNQLLERVRLNHGAVDDELSYLENLRHVKTSLMEKRDALYDFVMKLSG